DNPEPDAWISTIEELVGKPDNNTYMIGHSAGANAIMRYVSKGNSVGGIVLVAPWPSLNPEKRKYGKEMGARWLAEGHEWEAIAGNAKSIIAIFGTNDPYVDFNDSEIFREKLKARIVVEKDKKHLSEYHGVMELPSALDAVLEQSGLK
ncbi:MAG: RBBP9/YdeN family alpha/beta hydrolase, partial [Candidatus Micrarchaeales archaeon]